MVTGKLDYLIYFLMYSYLILTRHLTGGNLRSKMMGVLVAQW